MNTFPKQYVFLFLLLTTDGQERKIDSNLSDSITDNFDAKIMIETKIQKGILVQVSSRPSIILDLQYSNKSAFIELGSIR